MFSLEEIDKKIDSIHEMIRVSREMRENEKEKKSKKLTEKYSKLCFLIEYCAHKFLKDHKYIAFDESAISSCGKKFYFTSDDAYRFSNTSRRIFTINNTKYLLEIDTTPNDYTENKDVIIGISNQINVEEKRFFRKRKLYYWNSVLMLSFSRGRITQGPMPEYEVKNVSIANEKETQDIVNYFLSLIDKEKEDRQRDLDMLKANIELDEYLPEINYGTF